MLYWDTAMLICFCVVRSRVVVTETIWPAQPKIFRVWPFKKSLLSPALEDSQNCPVKRQGSWDIYLPPPFSHWLKVAPGVSPAPEVSLRQRDISAYGRTLSADMGTVSQSCRCSQVGRGDGGRASPAPMLVLTIIIMVD